MQAMLSQLQGTSSASSAKLPAADTQHSTGAHVPQLEQRLTEAHRYFTGALCIDGRGVQKCFSQLEAPLAYSSVQLDRGCGVIQQIGCLC